MEEAIQRADMDALLQAQAVAAADKVALRDGDRSVTWRELDDSVDGLAGGLSALGLVAGHRVAIALANSVEFVAAYLAILRGGLVAVPVNPTSRPGEISRVLRDCGARVCFADATSVDAVREAVSSMAAGVPEETADRPAPPPLVVTVEVSHRRGETAYDDLPAAGPRVVSPLDSEALAVLLYTSGTSGQPRAAMLSHRALLANVRQSAATTPPPVRTDDVVLGVLPMFHVYGLNAVLGQVLLTGATLVLGRRFDAEQTLELVARESVTCVPAAPPMVSAWLAAPRAAERLSSVHLLVSGAAPLADETVAAFEARTGITVHQGYGLTEAGPVVTSTLASPAGTHGGSGHALPGVEVRIVDETGADAEPDDPGEIWVRGDNVFSGYWPDGDGAPGPDGWLRTGDVGYLDADGDLFLVDRLKELVVVSGFNVYPSEIEDVIMEVPGVRECAVIGAPSEPAGEKVVAYVVPAPHAGGGLDAAVSAHCTARLARFKVPSRVEIVEQVPHSLSGKVAKGRLRARVARVETGLA